MNNLRKKNRFDAKSAQLTITLEDEETYVITRKTNNPESQSRDIAQSTIEAAYIAGQLLSNTVKAMKVNNCKVIKIIAKWN